MKSRALVLTTALAGATLLAATGCGPANSGVPGSSTVEKPDVTGTVFTIIFENHDQAQVLKPAAAPYMLQLSQTYSSANAYISNIHPSLPNYIELTSGATQGIGNDNDPSYAGDQIAGSDNLGDQLDAAGVKWRAYMESMGEPCKMDSTKLYAAHHAPFLYYSSLSSDKARCDDRVVDFEQNFAADLASNAYRYMWITPNMCNDMHDCTPDVSDKWLANVVPQIMDSPGYKNGEALFILFDEGNMRILGAAADLATIVISPNLVSPGYQSNTTFDHRSYLATMEDIFGMPRLTTTSSATPMDEFFKTASAPGSVGTLSMP